MFPVKAYELSKNTRQGFHQQDVRRHGNDGACRCRGEFVDRLGRGEMGGKRVSNQESRRWDRPRGAGTLIPLGERRLQETRIPGMGQILALNTLGRGFDREVSIRFTTTKRFTRSTWHREGVITRTLTRKEAGRINRATNEVTYHRHYTPPSPLRHASKEVSSERRSSRKEASRHRMSGSHCSERGTGRCSLDCYP